MNRRVKIIIFSIATLLIYFYLFGLKMCAILVYNTLNFLNNILITFNGNSILSAILTPKLTYILVGVIIVTLGRNRKCIGKILYNVLYKPMNSILNVLSNAIFKM